MNNPMHSENQELLISLLADGLTIDQCIDSLSRPPHLVDKAIVEDWLRDPELLKRAIKKSNDIIGQAWGTMWYSIKKQAMLGSIQHSKLLIDFITNNNRLPDNTLKLIFDKAVAGGIKDAADNEGVTNGY
jgi:hypothetical protein